MRKKMSAKTKLKIQETQLSNARAKFARGNRNLNGREMRIEHEQEERTRNYYEQSAKKHEAKKNKGSK